MIKALTIFLMLSIAVPGKIFSQLVKKGDYAFQIQKGSVIKGTQNTWTIPTTLTNLSKDTLKYFSSLCSWQEFYSVDNEKLNVITSLCERNTPVVLKLAPGQRTTRDLRLLITPTMDTTIIPFKVGFNLVRANKPISQFNRRDLLIKENVIWSNEIKIKN